MLLNKLKRHEDALKVCEEGLLRHPRSVQLYINKSHTLILLERYQEALDVFEQGLMLDPGNEMLLENKEIALRENDHSDI